MPVRILVTWVYNATRGSLPVVALLHASFDTTAGVAVLTTFYPGVDGRLLYAALGATALLVVVVTKGRLGLVAEPLLRPSASSPATHPTKSAPHHRDFAGTPGRGEVPRVG